MITLMSDPYTPLTQSSYNDVLASLKFSDLKCSCGEAGCLAVHGYYHRSVKGPLEKIKLRICRVRCSVCGVTHALLTASMVPNSQLSVSDQRQILHNYLRGRSYHHVLRTHLIISESDIRHIIAGFRQRWSGLLDKNHLFDDFLNISLFDLVKRCLTQFHRQFMQISNRINLLFEFHTF